MAEAEAGAAFGLTASAGFTRWLAGIGGSLALTTYQAGRLLFLSGAPGGGVSRFERDYPRCMGLAVAVGAQSFALATQFQLYRFNNIIGADEEESFDAAYAPHIAWTTGSVDAHDVGIGADGRPLFVSTLYSCIAAVSDVRNFKPIWKPRFVSALAPEDRCHLNGMAMADGRPVYATAVSQTDVKEGWREHRTDGGVVIDIESDEIVVDGLTMPHSPRLHDGRLWVLNSGAGEFGLVDRDVARFRPVAFCPGYARGLAFVGRHAVVGLSAPRQNDAFGGLALDTALAVRNQAPFCGLLVIDLASGSIVEWVRIEGEIKELYDVAFLPGVLKPSAVGFKTDEIRQRIAMEE